MKDSRKTKAQLIEELEALRAKVEALNGAGDAGIPVSIDATGVENRQIIHDVVWVIGSDFRIRSISPAVKAITGYTADELKYLPPKTFITPESFFTALLSFDQVQQIAEKGPSFKGMSRSRMEFLSKDGKSIWAETEAVPIFDGQGLFNGCFGVSTDVTKLVLAKNLPPKPYSEIEIRVSERTLKMLQDSRLLQEEIEKRNRFEQSLRESEEKYRNLVELANDGICIIQDERIIYCNPQLIKFMGMPLESLIGRSIREFVHPEDEKMLLGIYQNHMGGERDFGLIRCRFIRQDGQIVFMELNSNIIQFSGREAELVLIRDVTERLSEQIKLEESEEKYRSLIENQGEGVIIVDLDDQLTFANPAAAMILGEPVTQLIGKSISGYLDQKAQTKVKQERENRKRGKVSTYELDIIRTDGQKRRLLFTVTPNIDKNGNYAGSLGIFRDITDRVLARQALRDSEQRFRSFAQATSAAIFMYHKDKLLFVNKAAEKITGYSKEELEQMDIFQIISPEYRDLAFERGRARINGESPPTNYEIQIITKDGRHIWLDLSTGVMQYKGKPAILGTAFDITDRKDTEAALRQSEMRYRRLTENARDLIWRTDVKGIVFYVNSAVEHVLGYNPVEAIGMSVDQYLTQESALKVQAKVREAIETDPSLDFIQMDVQYKHQDGSVIPCELVMTLVRDVNGMIHMLEGVSRDMSERKRAEEEKIRLEKQLYQAQKMESIGTLAGGIAHDFNNSLQIVLTSANLAEDFLEPSDECYDHVQGIKRASKQMAKWTNDLLAYARGSFSLRRPLDVNEQIRASVLVVRHNLTGRISLKMDLEPDLPSIQASPGEIEQVFVNLLINATEAIQERGEIRVTTDLVNTIPAGLPEPKKPVKGYVHIALKDSGDGMSSETRERIFEPFYSTKFIGRGMGMAVVFGIVKSNDGYISVESEPGKGTLFEVYLPAIEGGKASFVDIQEQESLKTEPAKILLVDDEISLLRIAGTLLRKNGHEVITAQNGFQAIKVVKDNLDVGLVILDMVMPEMDGVQAYANLKQIVPHAKFLVISGYDEKGPAQQALSAGANGFLQKPFEIPQLLAKIDELFRS